MGFLKRVARVVSAPIVAPVQAVQKVVSGDVKGAAGSLVQGQVAMNPVSAVEAAANVSPTGFGQVAQGDTSPEALKKVATSSAIAGATALGGLAAGGAVSALSQGNLSGALSAGAGLAGIDPSLSSYLPEGMKEAGTIAKQFLPSGVGTSSGSKVSNVPVLAAPDEKKIANRNNLVLLGLGVAGVALALKKRR
jgi:hypothetical protein